MTKLEKLKNILIKIQKYDPDPQTASKIMIRLVILILVFNLAGYNVGATMMIYSFYVIGWETKPLSQCRDLEEYKKDEPIYFLISFLLLFFGTSPFFNFALFGGVVF